MTGEEDYTPRTITSVMEDDEQYFSFISKKYQDLTRFKGAPQSTKGEGAFSEWAYYHFGRWSFAANPWWVPDMEAKKDTTAPDTTRRRRPEDRRARGGGPPAATGEEKTDEYADQIKALKWIDANGLKNDFVAWTKVSHPDFPDNEVEVGGFTPYALTNPPPDSIERIAVKDNAFLAWLGGKLPTVGIRNVKVEPVDGKVFRLTVDIVNNGYLPTNSAMGSRARWAREVHVVLGLSKDQSLASGKAKMLLPAIKGSGGRQEISWLIVSRSGAGVTLTAESPSAGRVSQTITLK